MRSTHRKTAASVVAELDTLPPVGGTPVSVASFVGLDANGRFQVEVTGVRGPLVALSTIPLTAADAGTRVVVAYGDGDAARPIIIGRVHDRAAEGAPIAKVDGERLVIRADREIELRCGDASLVLTRAGKVLIRGNYVLTRSRGANRIKGAYVDIN